MPPPPIWLPSICPDGVKSTNLLHPSLIHHHFLSGTVDSTRCCDGAGDYPNMGNYGLVYHIHARITNTGTHTRHVSLNITAPLDCGVEMAYACGSSNPVWKPLVLNTVDPFEYCGVNVGSKQVMRLDAAYALGGPACGNLFHSFSITV